MENPASTVPHAKALAGKFSLPFTPEKQDRACGYDRRFLGLSFTELLFFKLEEEDRMSEFSANPAEFYVPVLP